MRELLGQRVEHRDGGTAARPHASLLIHANRVRAGAPAIGQRRILIFDDFLGDRVQTPDLAHRRLREPDVAVGGGNRRMNAGRLGKRQRESRQLGRLGVQANHFVAAPIVGNPEHPVLVFDGAPRPQALGSPKIVFHIGDIHGARAERTHQGLVFRQFLGRLQAWANRDRKQW